MIGPEDSPSLADMATILKMMSDHGVTNLVYRGLTITRVPEKSGPTSPEGQRELDRLRTMNPDSIDAAFMRNRYGGQ